MLLAANSVESTAGTLMSDAARLRNDVATSALTLVNAVQSSPIAAANQMNKFENVLAADWGRMQQAFVQFESAVLDAYQQEFDALLADWMVYPAGRIPTPPASPSTAASTNAPVQGKAASPVNDSSMSYSMTAPSLVQSPSQALSPLLQHNGEEEGGGSNGPLYVLDMNTGETIPANVTLNTFTNWKEDLLAQVSGGAVASYSWNLTQAPDLNFATGTNTANLQGTWGPGSAGKKEIISVTETPQVGQAVTFTMTFEVASFTSPAYSSSRPTSSSTWPTVITPDQINSAQATRSAGPYASIGEADGSVQTSFSMPSCNPNTTPVSLDYNSTTANSQPIFLDEYQLPTGQTVPSSITAQLTFDNTALSTVTYNTTGLNAGDIVQIALQANATGLTTGRYPWSITVTNGTNQTTSSGNVDIVNQSSSPYGAGWSLDNVEQLLPVTGGVILVNPDGTSLWFVSKGQGGYTTPAGDFSTLTLSNGVYTRTMPDGTKINFNSSGQETSTVDRDGNTTTFGYTSGQLTSITDMNNQVTTLTYSSGLLSGITDPANRTATLSYTGSQLTSITNPANDVWQYGYDSANDLTKLSDPNNHATSFTYNSADRVSSVTLADLTTEQLTAMQMNGWAAAGGSTNAVLLATGDQALTLEQPARAQASTDRVGSGVYLVGIALLASAGGATVSRSDVHERIFDLSGHSGRRAGRRTTGRSSGRDEELLRQWGEDAFGTPDARTAAVIERLNDLTRLEDLLRRVHSVTSWQELLGPPIGGSRKGRGRQS